MAIPFRRHAVSREIGRESIGGNINSQPRGRQSVVARNTLVRARCRRLSAVSGRARPAPTANIVPRCQSATSHRDGCSSRARAREFVRSAGKCDGFRMKSSLWEISEVRAAAPPNGEEGREAFVSPSSRVIREFRVRLSRDDDIRLSALCPLRHEGRATFTYVATIYSESVGK